MLFSCVKLSTGTTALVPFGQDAAAFVFNCDAQQDACHSVHGLAYTNLRGFREKVAGQVFAPDPLELKTSEDPRTFAALSLGSLYDVPSADALSQLVVRLFPSEIGASLVLDGLPSIVWDRAQRGPLFYASHAVLLSHATSEPVACTWPFTDLYEVAIDWNELSVVNALLSDTGYEVALSEQAFDQLYVSLAKLWGGPYDVKDNVAPTLVNTVIALGRARPVGERAIQGVSKSVERFEAAIAALKQGEVNEQS